MENSEMIFVFSIAVLVLIGILYTTRVKQGHKEYKIDLDTRDFERLIAGETLYKIPGITFSFGVMDIDQMKRLVDRQAKLKEL